jgi:hypothetical protein
MGETCNGFSNRIGGNEKIAKALDIKEDLNVNCLMYYKHCISFRHKDNKNDLKQMFQCKLACREISAHNVHEAKVAGMVQEGGTGTICFGESTGYIRKTGRDNNGIGRWCSTQPYVCVDTEGQSRTRLNVLHADVAPRHRPSGDQLAHN